MSQIKTAIVPAAGRGTRVQSITHGGSKEMLKVFGTTLIDHVLYELRNAGIENIVVVSHPDKKDLNEHLSVQNVTLLYQAEPKGLGHAILSAHTSVREQQFLVALPDEVIPYSNTTRELLQFNSTYSCDSIVSIQHIPDAYVHLYGMIKYFPLFGNLGKITGIREKPSIDETPSNYGVIGRYLLSSRIFHTLEKDAKLKDKFGGEIGLTEAIAQSISAGDQVLYYLNRFPRFDGGRADTYR
jgi:UTP--glucose-1-phosphate uridylyltransferase